MRTKNCIYCNSPAQLYSGHILKGSEKITAGTCNKHKESREYIGPNGYLGPYKKEFGLLSDFNHEYCSYLILKDNEPLTDSTFKEY